MISTVCYCSIVGHEESFKMAGMGQPAVSSERSLKKLSYESYGESFQMDESNPLKSVNPQFLVFQFLRGFIMRKYQVDKVIELYNQCSSPRNQSSVHELIMGSGKTACIAPMLCLLLCKGERPVMQMVPDQLLEQTRSVLQDVFSSVLIKKVQVLSFSRAAFEEGDSKPLEELEKQLVKVREEGNIILCSPSQMKKLLLKFVELMTALKDTNPLMSLPPSLLPVTIREKVAAAVKYNVEPKIKKLQAMAAILRLFRAPDQSCPGREGAVVIIDECDMIFDPLKSELNFPIGKKEVGSNGRLVVDSFAKKY